MSTSPTNDAIASKTLPEDTTCVCSVIKVTERIQSGRSLEFELKVCYTLSGTGSDSRGETDLVDVHGDMPQPCESSLETHMDRGTPSMLNLYWISY